MYVLKNPKKGEVEFKSQFQLITYLNNHAIEEGETRIIYKKEKEVPVPKIPSLSLEKVQSLLIYLKGNAKKSIKSHISRIIESQQIIKKEVSKLGTFQEGGKERIKMEIKIIIFHKRKMFVELVDYLKELRNKEV